MIVVCIVSILDPQTPQGVPSKSSISRHSPWAASLAFRPQVQEPLPGPQLRIRPTKGVPTTPAPVCRRVCRVWVVPVQALADLKEDPGPSGSMEQRHCGCGTVTIVELMLVSAAQPFDLRKEPASLKHLYFRCAISISVFLAGASGFYSFGVQS